MRVRGVGTGGAVGAVIGEEAGALDALLQEGDDAVLVGVAAAAGGVADELEAGAEDLVELLLGFEVGSDLGFGKDGFEVADHVGGADDLLAHGTDEFDGARVDHRDIHDGVARGVLHGNFFAALKDGGELELELLPRGVLAFCAGECVELEAFDAVNDFFRLSVRGDEVEPAAGDEAVLVEAENSVGDGVAVVVVVEKPAVKVLGADGGLNGFEIHLACTPPPSFSRKVLRSKGLALDFSVFGPR